ncbi:hypothetical protein BDV25DRAFT_21724 [Aspergillus avenaceus]|uniref:PD-(D/E)XK nuclease-like domain-containing protein n=1 Tax=Aspergillus avenaceus TaxID=36643 RepID=A0A5N6U596_ASPAV|nr:hypothetical protein BDV25DRAFT_21724 [Aspergillus avenaceus]
MKRKDIFYWLSRIQSLQNPSPPSTPVDIDQSHQTKRRKMSGSGTSTPRKRSRNFVDDDAASLLSNLSDRTRFEPSVQSSSATSRQRSPARDLLNELPLSSPPIHCFRPKSIPLPKPVLSLRQRLGRNLGVKLIPIQLKDKIAAEAPEEALEIPDTAFDDTINYTSDQLDILWQDMSEIYHEAAECEEYGQDENAWCSGVIQMILQKGIKRHTILQLKNVQSQTIDPNLLPRMRDKHPVSKKVDYTFAFSIREPQVTETYDHFLIASPHQTLSQTTDPFTKRVALFSGVEVKQSNGGGTEALVQLAIWLAAGLEKSSKLHNLRGDKSGNLELLPNIGWTVIGHDWNLYIAFRGLFEGQDRIYVDGPIESLGASTRTYYGIFKLVDLVQRLSEYARDVYWPWMRSEILNPPS